MMGNDFASSAAPTEPAAPALVCPQCRSPVGQRDKVCQTCGVDLALAAAMLEREALAFTPAEPSAPFFADLILPRFGEYLVTSGYISAAHLQEALERQRHLALQGQTETVGQVLLEQGRVTREQLDRASIRQVQELQMALGSANHQLQEQLNEQAQALQKALQKLAELNALKANFVANLSHELRTPLAQVLGYADLLERGNLGEMTPEQHEAMRVIYRGGVQLKGLIDDLLRFSMSMRGELTLNPSEVAVEAVAQEALQATQPKAERAQVALVAALPEQPATWPADREKLSWVLNQLLDNAVKFTPAGGQVTLSLARVDHEIHLSVADTGIGFPIEDWPALLAPFHQRDGSATRRYGGTGLGLALVKRIVDAHHGRLEVESQPNQGSRFTVCLPGPAS